MKTNDCFCKDYSASELTACARCKDIYTNCHAQVLREVARTARGDRYIMLLKRTFSCRNIFFGPIVGSLPLAPVSAIVAAPSVYTNVMAFHNFHSSLL